MAGIESKLIEVRDKATCIVVFAVRLSPRDPLVRHAGWGHAPVFVGTADGKRAARDPMDWPGTARTLPAAHRALIDRWDDFPNGSVLDVRVVLGEASDPAPSDIPR